MGTDMFRQSSDDGVYAASLLENVAEFAEDAVFG